MLDATVGLNPAEVDGWESILKKLAVLGATEGRSNTLETGPDAAPLMNGP